MKSLKELRIVFMGTPEFAVATLAALLEAGAQIVGVITAPDKPAGRGMRLSPSAVKEYALEQGLAVLQPEKLKDPAFLHQLQELKADVQIVVAFRMLPEQVWSMPPMGTINLHGSLLPKYRGAAPINWAVINGEKQTGVTTFKLQHAIDTGNILLQAVLPIEPADTAGSMHDKMMQLGAALVVKSLEGLLDGSIKETPQPVLDESTAKATAAPKIFTQTCKLDFDKGVEVVHNLIRGLSPFPAAFTYLDDKVLKVFEAHIEGLVQPNLHAAGQRFTDGKTYLKFSCPDGYICLDDIQLAGKKRMKTVDFLRGYHFES
ncbi:MAG TPA: methionyl-tRNA formyltransferase [Arachidicoccus sp.]|nr:methionyl-tRNA formyltransferase [Arachidicoccus sp.]